jgi:hypothetical protein
LQHLPGLQHDHLFPRTFLDRNTSVGGPPRKWFIISPEFGVEVNAITIKGVSARVQDLSIDGEDLEGRV